MKLIKFAPLVNKKISATVLASAIGVLAMTGTAQAEVKAIDVQGYANLMKTAANAKNIEQVAKLIADDAIISITRNGKSGTMNKKEYLQRLTSNWKNSSEYSYSITVDNVVSMGDKAKADITTIETVMKEGQQVKFVTNSRATLTGGNDNIMLLKSVSQVTID